MALSVKASELLEIFQWLTPEEAAGVMENAGTAHRVRDEMADALACLLQFCEVLEINVFEARTAKIDRNELRFPEPGRAADLRAVEAALVSRSGGRVFHNWRVIHRNQAPLSSGPTDRHAEC